MSLVDKKSYNKGYLDALSDASSKPREEFSWLIEAPGPAYLSCFGDSAVVKGELQVSVHQTFIWSVHVNDAIRFSRKEDAEKVLFAVRSLLNEKLVPACYPHFPKAVEHGWVDAKKEETNNET